MLSKHVDEYFNGAKKKKKHLIFPQAIQLVRK